jgi:pimeloyl-ACP methyl ester carboxylesterase
MDVRTFAAPSLTLFGVEFLRATLEYAGMRCMDPALLPSGDGHPVVIFPGLATDKTATGPLKDFLDRLGYTAYDWGRGINTGPVGNPDDWLDELAEHVDALTKGHKERVSFVGWSLGGIYARELAKRRCARVRRVVTIGTPLSGAVEHTNVGWVYRLLNGHRAQLDTDMRRRLRTAPPVPTTAIYSRTDGVVAWQACVQEGSGAHIENIEVEGSHCGLGWNAQVLKILADRLRRR